MTFKESALFRLDNKVAVVTGALGRLGLTWCKALLVAGAKIAALDLPETPISPAFETLRSQHESTLKLYHADVCDKKSLLKTKDACLTDLGIPEIIVNNAGIDQPPQAVKSYRLEEIPAELLRNVFEVNIIGAFSVIQVFGAEMVKARKGSIINIGSLYASVSPDARLYDHMEVTPPFLKPPAYGASKAALNNLTKYFATHWGPSGIRVNTLSPGGVLAGQDKMFQQKYVSRVPMNRMASPDDLHGPLVFLASDASSYVNGIELRIDGGYTAW